MGNENTYPPAACRIMDTMNVAAAVIARNDGVIWYVNNRSCIDLHMTGSQIVGKSFYQIYWPDFCLMLESLFSMALDGNVHTQIHYWAERNFWGQASVCSFDWNAPGDTFLLTVTNITEISKSEYEYKRLAYYDTQLDLPNARKLEVDLRELNNYNQVALLHFSVEHYYSINNLYGLDTGDYLLQQVRNWLEETALPNSQLYRTHDAAFAILLRNAEPDEAKQWAETILERFRHHWELPPGDHSLPLYCTIKLGVVLGKNLDKDVRNLLYRTVVAPINHGSYVLYNADLEQRINNRLQLRQHLVNCVQDNMRGFEVYYQPILEAEQSRWAGAEALCRWTTPEGKVIPPSVFIDEAEQMGLITQIDDWVMETALADCKHWNLTDKDFFIDINVSPLRRVDERFVLQLLKLIRRCELPEGMVNLEITETAKFNFSTENMRHWERLTDAGVVIGLDDFGTGYSSFNNLVHIPAKLLKTEKCFIDELETDKYLQYLVKHTIQLAHTAGMRIISEGVETEGQKRLLQSFGVDFMQGFLFSQPLPAKEFARQLHRYKQL